MVYKVTSAYPIGNLKPKGNDLEFSFASDLVEQIKAT